MRGSEVSLGKKILKNGFKPPVYIILSLHLIVINKSISVGDYKEYFALYGQTSFRSVGNSKQIKLIEMIYAVRSVYICISFNTHTFIHIQQQNIMLHSSSIQMK